MSSIRSCVPIVSIAWRVLTLAGLLVAAALPAHAVAPPAVRLQITPGPDADGVPSAEQIAPAGPIQDAVTNGQSTLSAEGSVTVDYGTAAVRAASGYGPGGMQIYAPWCTAASGACAVANGEWADTIVLHSPEAQDGTTGSFTVALSVDGALAASLPGGWSSYQGTMVRSTWNANVWIDDVVRDTLVMNCFGTLAGACTPAGVRNYYPPGGGYVSTPVPVAFGTFALGPYDFTWGQPFKIDVLISANTAVSRAGNTTGSPAASAELGAAMLALTDLYGASAGGGIPLDGATATASAASGSAWLGVALPEPASDAAGALAAAALAAARTRRRRGGARRWM